jgi:hypothetical protein
MKHSRDMRVLFFRTGTLSPMRSLYGAYAHTTLYIHGRLFRNQATAWQVRLPDRRVHRLRQSLARRTPSSPRLSQRARSSSAVCAIEASGRLRGSTPSAPRAAMARDDVDEDIDEDGKERECCLLVLDSVTSTQQWTRQPRPRECVHDVCVFVCKCVLGSPRASSP